ncbi:CTLH/CRA C-terminal to lish motif domain-containing protein [Echria macrotheca]|uniref:CTLH/CRA C-terminal to lish motif domain-containing protein n=1 Tax=Echria macrotheca TaxID=438768 RepID=A0AAJ0FA56_9PEZI|nr:CTLH/CRA C-terminal to lish motif domain-containing protein [Echria macrotheca]
MADYEETKINQEAHLLLDQPLLRLPYELLRKNLRNARFQADKDATFVKNLLKETATGSLNAKTSPEDVVKNLDVMITRMRGLKRKLSACADEEDRLYRHLEARVAHLSELSTMHTVEDVKYEAWSRKRLDRLMVDYLLRHGYNASATALAEDRGIQELVDIDTFVAMSNIRNSLLNGSFTEALAWCTDNKKALREMKSKLEFMLRCQQFIEMMRTDSPARMNEAIAHAKRFIIPFNDTYQSEVSQVAALLAYRPDTTMEPYASWYSPKRWALLADIFTEAHNQLLGLPTFPLLHIALSSGLSALKTPACHSTHGPSSSQPFPNFTGISANLCPICSTELNELARGIPYAQHSRSYVDSDLLMLPNGRVYGKARLQEYASKAGLGEDQVKDLVTSEIFPTDKLRRVYIT